MRLTAGGEGPDQAGARPQQTWHDSTLAARRTGRRYEEADTSCPSIALTDVLSANCDLGTPDEARSCSARGLPRRRKLLRLGCLARRCPSNRPGCGSMSAGYTSAAHTHRRPRPRYACLVLMMTFLLLLVAILVLKGVSCLPERPAGLRAQPPLPLPGGAAWAAPGAWRWPLPADLLDRGIVSDGDPQALQRLGRKLLAGEAITVGEPGRCCLVLNVQPAALCLLRHCVRLPSLSWCHPPHSHAGRQPDLWARRQQHGADGLGAAAARLAAGGVPWCGPCRAQRGRGSQPKRIHGLMHAGVCTDSFLSVRQQSCGAVQRQPGACGATGRCAAMLAPLMLLRCVPALPLCRPTCRLAVSLTWSS